MSQNTSPSQPRTTSSPPLVVEETPGFLPPLPPRGPDQLDPSVTTTRATSTPAGDGGVADLGPLPATEPKTTASSLASSDPVVYEGLFRAGFGLTGAGLAMRLGPRWMPTDDEIDGVAAPLARIAARHSPVKIGATSDLTDAIEATLVFGGYAISRVVEAAQEDAQLAAAEAHAADALAAHGAG